jgi:uncharacterized protein (TIGR03083 family)
MADKAPDIDHIEVLAAEGAALIAAVRAGPRGAPIAACPGWDVTALAGHIGTTWRWSGQIVKERLSAPLRIDPDPGLTPDQAVGWLEAALVEVLDALRGCPADEPVWGFGLQPRTAQFWRRRQAQEAVVHRVDAELATERLAPVDPMVAADGVGEFIDVMLGRMYRGQDPPAGQLAVHASDTGGTWSTGDPAGGVASLSGSAEDLLLVLWGRRDIAAVEAAGDPQVLAGWRRLGAP